MTTEALSFSDDVLTVVDARLAKASTIDRVDKTNITYLHILTMKNSNFGRTFFIYISQQFSSNLRHEMTCFAAVFAFLLIPKPLLLKLCTFLSETTWISNCSGVEVVTEWQTISGHYISLQFINLRLTFSFVLRI